MTEGTTHRMFGKILVCLYAERPVEVIRQLIFKFVTKHLFLKFGAEISNLRNYASTTRIRRSIFASSMRPRLILDLTVPSGIFNKSTIS